MEHSRLSRREPTFAERQIGGGSTKRGTVADSGALKKKELLFATHRHWIWAVGIRSEYYERLKANPPSSGDLLEWFLTGEAMYLCIWYGLLFTGCEGLRKNGFTVPDAQTEIDAVYDSLRLFRNAIFHVQTKY